MPNFGAPLLPRQELGIPSQRDGQHAAILGQRDVEYVGLEREINHCCHKDVFCSNRRKPTPINFNVLNLDAFCANAQTQLFQLLDKQIAVDQIDGGCAVPCRLFHRVLREIARGDEESFVCLLAHHCAAGNRGT